MSISKKIFFIAIRQFVISLAILLGIPVFSEVGFLMLKDINPVMAYIMTITGPYSLLSWFIFLIMVGWYPIILAIWVIRDAVRFEKQGISTRPILWGIGTVLPTVFIVFPAYYVIRDVIWLEKIKKINASTAEQQSSKGNFYNIFSRNFFLNALAVIFIVCVAVMVTDLPGKLNKKKTDEQVVKIHATKLTLDDVMGKNLPPDPGAYVDKTVEGIDANKNGIRDDVELAIFKAYPDSAKIRAALLQYALALQMEMTQTIVNKETVTAVAEETSRSSQCISDLVPRKSPESSRSYADIEKINKYTNFVETKQLNTSQRKKQENNFYRFTMIVEIPSSDYCDIDLSSLQN